MATILSLRRNDMNGDTFEKKDLEEINTIKEMNSSVEIIEDSGDSEEKDVLFTVSIGMSRDKEDDAESCNCDTTYSSSQEEEEAVGALEDDGEKKDIW
ncbi:uncharacterized protein HKW66_Vig0020000 [Vigna angularis]|uniref:Uncharacterized protein n=1 Tax=Phaseolus angularis TaxID=3914 RepID=A0A8T0L8H1_PHAAN|nr:uncharacterized protein HKW66_Vig0020000 [Vigna angularis]